MTRSDRERWDARHAEQGSAADDGPPADLAAHETLLPNHGRALELACGRGRAAVWLARRGLHVHAVDVSPVAVELARDLAESAGMADRCTFEVADLDDGLPPGRLVDLVLCHRFHSPQLAGEVVQRVIPGGLVAVSVLSEVGADPGRFRAGPGELRAAYCALDVVVDEEAHGVAVLIGRRTA